MRARVVMTGIYLGLWCSALLALALGTMVLSSHPIFWARDWWQGAIGCAIGWICLVLGLRMTRGIKAELTCTIIGGLIVSWFVGPMIAFAVCLCCWLIDPPKRTVRTALTLSNEDKKVLRWAAGLSVAATLVAATVSFGCQATAWAGMPPGFIPDSEIQPSK